MLMALQYWLYTENHLNIDLKLQIAMRGKINKQAVAHSCNPCTQEVGSGGSL